MYFSVIEEPLHMPRLNNLLSSPFVKVITGIANTQWAAIADTVTAAQQANAPALDVAATDDIVSRARQAFDGVLFASSVSPQALLVAAQRGADVLELGNYDGLYAEGQFFTGADVMALTRQTLALLNNNAITTPLCVTVPGHLDADSQQQLARDLQAAGVAMIQTEGAARLLGSTPTVAPLAPEEQAALTLRNATVLVAATTLPVMAASGITADNAATMLRAGVAGVGVGRAVRNAGNTAAQVAVVTEVMAAVNQPAMAAVG